MCTRAQAEVTRNMLAHVTEPKTPYCRPNDGFDGDLDEDMQPLHLDSNGDDAMAGAGPVHDDFVPTTVTEGGMDFLQDAAGFSSDDLLDSAGQVCPLAAGQ